jgi:hypothetical protein
MLETHGIVLWAHIWLYEWLGAFAQSHTWARMRALSSVHGLTRVGSSPVLFMFFLFTDNL